MKTLGIKVDKKWMESKTDTFWGLSDVMGYFVFSEIFDIFFARRWSN